MKRECIYVPGETNIIDMWINGKTQIYKKTLAEVQKDNLNAEIWDFEKACDEINIASEKKYVTEFKEISEVSYWDALEVLPPENFKRISHDTTAFRMCEYYTGTITGHYFAITDATGERFFSALKNTGDYSEMKKEILAKYYNK